MGIHKEISSVKKEVIEENIQNLLHYGLDTHLRVTITSKNYYLLRQICEDAIILGAKGIKFTNFMRMGAATNLEQENILTNEQIKIFFKELSEARKIYPKEKFLIRRCGSFGDNSLGCKFTCTAAKDSVAITPELKVYPCFFLTKKGMEIGYVDNEGKIIIDKEIKHDGKRCLAREINNNGYEISWNI